MGHPPYAAAGWAAATAAARAAPDAKRQKLDDGAPIIRPSLLAPEGRAALAAEFAAGQPYPHLVLRDVCDPHKLRAVRDEIINNVQARPRGGRLWWWWCKWWWWW